MSLDRPGFLINLLCHHMTYDLEKLMRVYGVTSSWWAILALLWEQEGIPQVEVQQRLCIEGATVTGLAKRMEQAGLIRRESNGNDKRVKLMFLTDYGRNLRDLLVPEAKKINEVILKDFTEEERKLFISFLSRGIQNIRPN